MVWQSSSPRINFTATVALSFEELLVITHRFHNKPLLPFFTNDGLFYIRALSQNEVRLLEGTCHSIDEIKADSIPAICARLCATAI